MVGARLGHFVASWENITEKQWVLSVIQRGYRIPFIAKHPLSPTLIVFRQLNISVLEEVQLLLDKGVVESGFYSRIFLVPKKNGILRLITEHFCGCSRVQNGNTGQSQTGDSNQRLGVFSGSDRCISSYASRKYLRLCLRNQVFQYRALPFRLTTSPHVFTRLMAAIAIHFRKRAMFPYLDDWLVRNQNQDQDQDSLLVKRRNDNHSPGPVIRELVPSSHQRSELSNTILCIFSG